MLLNQSVTGSLICQLLVLNDLVHALRFHPNQAKFFLQLGLLLSILLLSNLRLQVGLYLHEFRQLLRSLCHLLLVVKVELSQLPIQSVLGEVNKGLQEFKVVGRDAEHLLGRRANPARCVLKVKANNIDFLFNVLHRLLRVGQGLVLFLNLRFRTANCRLQVLLRLFILQTLRMRLLGVFHKLCLPLAIHLNGLLAVCRYNGRCGCKVFLLLCEGLVQILNGLLCVILLQSEFLYLVKEGTGFCLLNESLCHIVNLGSCLPRQNLLGGKVLKLVLPSLFHYLCGLNPLLPRAVVILHGGGEEFKFAEGLYLFLLRGSVGVSHHFIVCDSLLRLLIRLLLRLLFIMDCLCNLRQDGKDNKQGGLPREYCGKGCLYGLCETSQLGLRPLEVIHENRNVVGNSDKELLQGVCQGGHFSHNLHGCDIQAVHSLGYTLGVVTHVKSIFARSGLHGLHLRHDASGLGLPHLANLSTIAHFIVHVVKRNLNEVVLSLQLVVRAFEGIIGYHAILCGLLCVLLEHNERIEVYTRLGTKHRQGAVSLSEVDALSDNLLSCRCVVPLRSCVGVLSLGKVLYLLLQAFNNRLQLLYLGSIAFLRHLCQGILRKVGLCLQPVKGRGVFVCGSLGLGKTLVLGFLRVKKGLQRLLVLLVHLAQLGVSLVEFIHLCGIGLGGVPPALGRRRNACQSLPKGLSLLLHARKHAFKVLSHLGNGICEVLYVLRYVGRKKVGKLNHVIHNYLFLLFLNFLASLY